MTVLTRVWWEPRLNEKGFVDTVGFVKCKVSRVEKRDSENYEANMIAFERGNVGTGSFGVEPQEMVGIVGWIINDKLIIFVRQVNISEGKSIFEHVFRVSRGLVVHRGWTVCKNEACRFRFDARR